MVDPFDRFVSALWDGLRRLGERKRVEIDVDPRLLATWFAARPRWTHASGANQVSVGRSSRDIAATVAIELSASFLLPDWRPGD